MTSNIALRVALGSGIIFPKFDLRQLTRSSIIAFLCWYLMPRYDLDLWSLNFYSTLGVMRLNSVQNLSEIE